MDKDTEKLRDGATQCNNSAEYINGEIPSLTKQDQKELSSLEKWKRKRTVRNAKLLFRAIDVLFKKAQNSCPYVDKDNSKSIHCIKDIVYDEAHAEVCKFDFYRKKTGGKLPAVILIHGGGFIAGDKKYRRGRAQYFALNGFAVFCINYGLAPDFTFPEPLIHIVTAANYIYDNAEKYNIDIGKIFVDGDSAGGYYAAMLSAFNCNDKLKEVFGCAPKFRIFGALYNCGVYDMQTVIDTKYPFDIADGVILSLTGVRSSDFESYEHKDYCVPIEFVSADYPPTFLIYSDNDTFCKGQGNKMLAALDSVGVYCEHYVARHSTSNHCFSLTWTGEDASVANELMMSFAKRLAADKIKL